MKFRMRRVKVGEQKGQFYWTLLYENGEPACTSETYKRKIDCRDSIFILRREFFLQRPPIVDETGTPGDVGEGGTPGDGGE